MSKCLHVLFVDDSEDDVVLLLREFKKAGYLIESQRVQTLPDVAEALTADGWELILLDYNLPAFTCFDVLTLISQQALDIPVIVVSGIMGEELAVEVMRAGAHDYILKQRISRLIPAVERELAEMKIHRDKQQALRELETSEERFRLLTESILESIFLIDLSDMRVLYASASFELLTELPTSWLVGHSASRLLELVHPEDYARVQSRLAMAGWSAFNDEFRIVRPSGEERWIHARHSPVYDKEGRITRVSVIAQDITERMRLQQDMETMLKVLEQTADSVMVTDSNGIIEYVNPAFENVTGYNRNEVLGCKPNILKSGFQDASFYARVWEVLVSGMPFSDLFINRRKDGELYYESKTISPIRDRNGTITHYVSTGKDITQRLLIQERFQQVVNYDTVTGLASRILFKDRLEQALLEARRRKHPLAVLCIRIGISELLGDVRQRSAAEALLRTLAQRLHEVAGPECTVARLSDDEFVVMDRRCESREQVEQLARELVTALTEPLQAEGFSVYVSPTIGISLFPEDGDQTEQLLQHAVSALKQVRRGVQEPYLFYQRHMDPKKGRLPN